MPTRTESLGHRHNRPEPASCLGSDIPTTGIPGRPKKRLREESLRDLQVLVGIEGCHGGRFVSRADICELVEELVIV